MFSLVLPGLGLTDRLVPCCLHRRDQAPAARKRPNSIFSEEGSDDTSIGADSDEEEEEVESKKSDGAFGSLDVLEDSLPVKYKFFLSPIIRLISSGNTLNFWSFDGIEGGACQISTPERPDLSLT